MTSWKLCTYSDIINNTEFLTTHHLFVAVAGTLDASCEESCRPNAFAKWIPSWYVVHFEQSFNAVTLLNIHIPTFCEVCVIT